MRPVSAADHSPLQVPRSWKSRAIPLPNLRACVAYEKGENLPTIETEYRRSRHTWFHSAQDIILHNNHCEQMKLRIDKTDEASHR